MAALTDGSAGLPAQAASRCLRRTSLVLRKGGEGAAGQRWAGPFPFPFKHKEESMTLKMTSVITLASVALLAAGSAHAGPPVLVTFKNLSSEAAALQIITSNESSTYQIADPKPEREVSGGTSIVFKVQRVISPDVNAAMVRYKIGQKVCAFGTTYQMRMMPGGIVKPEWTKSATPSGGASCTATITYIGADNSWRAEFTMK